MSKIVTKLEDVGDERDQKVLAVVAKVWFNGDIQAALDWYNKSGQEMEELEKQTGVVTWPNGKPIEVQLRFKQK